MGFWANTLSNCLGGVGAAFVLVALYVVIQWFLAATDITISYAWKFDGPLTLPKDFRPTFDIRNRSRTRTYRLANIAYSLEGKTHGFDNHSIWGSELPPGSIRFFDEVTPVKGLNSFNDCSNTQVAIRLENGRTFWLQGQGLGQLKMGRIQRVAFLLRSKLEAAAVPME